MQQKSEQVTGACLVSLLDLVGLWTFALEGVKQRVCEDEGQAQGFFFFFSWRYFFPLLQERHFFYWMGEKVWGKGEPASEGDSASTARTL